MMLIIWHGIRLNMQQEETHLKIVYVNFTAWTEET
jgi:hypothetical protein